jgi:hypothetical protein
MFTTALQIVKNKDNQKELTFVRVSDVHNISECL